MNNFKTLAEFLSFFKDEQTCHSYFEKIRFRNGEYCPHCGHQGINRFTDGKRFRCKKCEKDFTIRTGTVFGASKLPLQKWFIAIYLLSISKKGISSIQLAKQVGVTQKTAWHLDHRIRSAMKQNNGKLFGVVEVDETYVGGREKNKHASKRIKGTQGRNTKTKTPVIGFLQRDGQIQAQVIGNVKTITIEKQVVDRIKFSSKIYTDDFKSYVRIGRYCRHEVVKHGSGEYAREGGIHSNGIESFWSLLKRGYHGIYHQMSKKHLQRYVDEFVYRFNRRKDVAEDVFSNIVLGVSVNPKLTYKELVKPNGQKPEAA